eukprot:gene6669-8249_t
MDQQQQKQQQEDIEEELLRQDIKNYIKSLELPYPNKAELEYYEKIIKSLPVNPIISLIVVSVDKMLTEQERAMIPKSYRGIKIVVEHVLTIEDEELQKQLQQQLQESLEKGGDNDGGIIEEDEDESDNEDDEDEMKQ